MLSIGMALQRIVIEYFGDKVEYLWYLAEEVEPDIRRALKEYKKKFLE